MTTPAVLRDVDDRVARLVRFRNAARHAQVAPGARRHLDQVAKGWWACLDE